MKAGRLQGYVLAGLLAASFSSLAATGEVVNVPWRAGNADAFQTGAAEERWAKAAQGSLPVTMKPPPG